MNGARSGTACALVIAGALLTAGPGPTVAADVSPESHQKRARQKAPKVGDPAPLFKLPRLGDREEVDLRDLAGDRPIVLYFGSYT